MCENYILYSYNSLINHLTDNLKKLNLDLMNQKDGQEPDMTYIIQHERDDINSLNSLYINADGFSFSLTFIKDYQLTPSDHDQIVTRITKTLTEKFKLSTIKHVVVIPILAGFLCWDVLTITIDKDSSKLKIFDCVEEIQITEYKDFHWIKDDQTQLEAILDSGKLVIERINFYLKKKCWRVRIFPELPN
jgi:hypothetical protein